MHRALGLLLLAAEGALAQSREPSQWDANVPGYGNVIVDGCPCTADCRPDNAVTVLQTGTSAVTATFYKNEPLKFAYLADQDGTILDYKADDTAWDGTGSRTVKFTWDASKQPTGVVPHIVYNASCADVTTSVVTSTWVRQGPHPPRPAHAQPCSGHHDGARALRFPTTPRHATQRRCACHRSAASWRSWHRHTTHHACVQ